MEQDGLNIISAMIQDSVLPIKEISWLKKQYRFVLLINRFRWEDKEQALLEGRSLQRVQSLLSVENVTLVNSLGINQKTPEQVISILSILAEKGSNKEICLHLALAGGGAFRLKIEALEVKLKDVTKPYKAISDKVPSHTE